MSIAGLQEPLVTITDVIRSDIFVGFAFFSLLYIPISLFRKDMTWLKAMDDRAANYRKSITFPRVLTAVFYAFVIAGCSDNSKNQKIITEGRVVYAMSGDVVPPGQTIEFLFNEDNLVIKYNMANDRTSITKFDKRTGEALTLVKEWFANDRDLYFYYDLPTNAFNAGLFAFHVDVKENTTLLWGKSVLGYYCKHAVQSNKSASTIDVWYTDQIRPGTWPPATQLTDNRLPLVYHHNYAGRITHYEATSVSDQDVPDGVFKHTVPDEFYFKTPSEYFSASAEVRAQFKDVNIPSFKYPHYNGSRLSTISYFKDKFAALMSKYRGASIELKFIVDKVGKVSGIAVTSTLPNANDHSKQSLETQAAQVLKEAGDWTPASVRGAAVNSKISFAY